jgi:hypothetical protein
MDFSQVIDTMVTDIMNNSSSDARSKFNDVMASKLTDALDAKKQELQQTLYRSEPAAAEPESTENVPA